MKNYAKILIGAFLGFILLTTTSCNNRNSSLSLTFGDNNAFLIDSTTTSCTAIATNISSGSSGGTTTTGDISSLYFQLHLPQIHWKDTKKIMVVSYIAIEFTDAAVTPQKCTIGGTELSNLFATSSGAWTDFTLPAAGSEGSESLRDSWSQCRQISCGGFKINQTAVGGGTATVGQQTFTGVAKIIGYAQDPDTLEDTPEVSETSVSIQYIPN